MFSVAPNILLAPNMTQNAERKHRTQDANTAHNRLRYRLRGRQMNVTELKGSDLLYIMKFSVIVK